MTLAIRILALIVLQVAILALLLGRNATIYQSPERMLVRSEALPGDAEIKAGARLNLSFNINTVRLGDVQGDNDFSQGDIIFVVFERFQRTRWLRLAVSKTPPLAVPFDPDDDRVVLRGRVQSIDMDVDADGIERAETLTVRYGFERYVLDRATAERLREEGVGPRDRLAVELAVNRAGAALVRNIEGL